MERGIVAKPLPKHKPAQYGTAATNSAEELEDKSPCQVLFGVRSVYGDQRLLIKLPLT
jgi:hypothetical protein